MAKSEFDRNVDLAIEFVHEQWKHFRKLASAAYAQRGRGAFLFDLLRDREKLSQTGESITYLTEANAKSFSDGIASWMLSGELDAYDEERQVVFVFWNPETKDAAFRVLAEWPNGTPRPWPDKKWAFAPRECPECRSTFIALGDFGVCSSCQHQFLASDVEYSKQNHSAIPPIAKGP